jgi:hypothetical protein
MNVAVTFTGKEVFNESLNLTDAKLLLESLNPTDVLRLCALLNAFHQISAYQFRRDGYRTPEAEASLKWLLEQLLHPDYQKTALEKIYRKSAPRHFSPLNGAAINGVMGLACRWCPKDRGHRLNSIEHGQNVARVLFALQGAMMAKENVVSIEDVTGQRAAFPDFVKNILANQPVRVEHDLGRLHAFASRPEIAGRSEHKPEEEMLIDKWFTDKFGLSVLEYQCCFTALSGYASKFVQDNHVSQLHLRLDRFLNLLNGPRDRVEELLRLAETTPERVVEETDEPKQLADAVFCIDHLLVYPLLKIGDIHLVTSFEAVFSKFIRGLPYLATLKAEQSKPGGGGAVRFGSRAGFGKIFEGYAGWLAHQWFDGSDVKIIEDYRVQLPGRKMSGFAQRDLLLIRDDVGYAIETKAIVPNLDLRKTGDLEEIVRKIVPRKDDGSIDPNGLVFQARTAAEALTAGTAFLKDEKTPIPLLRRVFPIGIVFEQLPLRFYNSKPFEMDVVKAYGSDVFRDSGKIAPIQFFDIQEFEEWDIVFDMPSEAGLLLVALEKRAYNEILR